MRKKKCTQCGKVKDETEFWKERKNENVLHSQCKECMKKKREEKPKDGK